MTVEKALSKMGHNSTPNGRSILGRGSDFRISVVLDDIVEVGYGGRMSAATIEMLRRSNYASSVFSEEKMYLQRNQPN